jgi:UDP-N-acetylglucosamine/UDP-N-acetylgalactosamine 4-epimerase
MSPYDTIQAELKSTPRAWLITGVAGFIGSNLLEQLLRLGQAVVGLDNLATGKRSNLAEVRALVAPAQWERFRFIEGDLSDVETCRRACAGVELVLHQAALGSVPRSLTDPLGSHQANVTGFVNMLEAARQAGVRRLVYASSSSVYGDDPRLPKVEEHLGKPLSPYAATKRINEVYADAYAKAYRFETVGLRYFNVFGARQDPEGAYAAVIPKWIAALLRRQPVEINGDGSTSRDFCYIQNVVQANLLAATATNPDALNQAYNVAVGERTTLNDLFALLKKSLSRDNASLADAKPVYRDFRAGDVLHSLADISQARSLLGYEPTHRIEQGLELAMNWYRRNVA